MKNDRVSVPPLTAASDMGRRRSGNAAKALLRDGHEASSSDGDFTLACSGDSMEADEPSSVTELLAQKLSMQDVVFVEVKAERTPSRQSWKIPARDSDEESDIFFFIDEDTEALDSKPRKGGNSLNTRQSATPAKPKQLKPAAARAVASEEADARQELADDEDIERDFLAEDLAEPPATTPATGPPNSAATRSRPTEYSAGGEAGSRKQLSADDLAPAAEHGAGSKSQLAAERRQPPTESAASAKVVPSPATGELPLDSVWTPTSSVSDDGAAARRLASSATSGWESRPRASATLFCPTAVINLKAEASKDHRKSDKSPPETERSEEAARSQKEREAAGTEGANSKSDGFSLRSDVSENEYKAPRGRSVVPANAHTQLLQADPGDSQGFSLLSDSSQSDGGRPVVQVPAAAVVNARAQLLQAGPGGSQGFSLRSDSSQNDGSTPYSRPGAQVPAAAEVANAHTQLLQADPGDSQGFSLRSDSSRNDEGGPVVQLPAAAVRKTRTPLLQADPGGFSLRSDSSQNDGSIPSGRRIAHVSAAAETANARTQLLQADPGDSQGFSLRSDSSQNGGSPPSGRPVAQVSAAAEVANVQAQLLQADPGDSQGFSLRSDSSQNDGSPPSGEPAFRAPAVAGEIAANGPAQMLQADRGDLQAFRLRSDSSQSVDSAPRENPAHTPVFGERRSVGCPPPTSLVETSEPSRRPTGRGLEARDLWKNSASHQSLGPSRGASDSLGDTRSEADRVDAAPAAERGGARFLRGPDGSLTPAMSYESASVVSPVDTASAEAVLGQLADERTQRTSVEEEEDTSRSLLCDTIVARLESLLDEEGTNARRQLVSLTVLSVTSNDSDNSQRNGQSDGNGQDSDAKHAFSPPASESPFPSLPGDSPGSLPAARDGASEGPGSDRARPAAADPAQRSDSPGGSEGFRLGSQSSAGGRGAAAPRTPRDQPGASDRRESPFCLQSDPSDGQESSFCIRSESAASEEKPQPADTIVPDTTGENLVLRAFEDDWEATRKAVEESAWEDGNRLFMQVQITCADFTEDDKREDLLCEESMARSRVVLLSMWKRDALQQEQDDKAEDAAAASGSIAASVEKHAVDPVAAPACSDAAPASRDSRTSDTPADSSTNLPSPAERSNHAADSIENQNADTLVQPAPPVSSTERPSDPPAGSPAGQSPVGRPGLAASVGKHNGVALAVPASPAGSSEPMASRDSRTSDPPAGSPASQATVEVVHHAADADDSSDKGARPGDHPPTGRINDATVSVGRHAVGSSPNIDSPASSISPARDAASTPLAAGDSPPMQRQAERSPAKTAQAVDTLQTPTATRTPTAARSDGLATGVPAGAVRTGAAADSTEKRAETSAASMPPGAFVPSDPRPGEAPDAPEKRIVGSSPDIGPPASSDSPARDAASTAGDSPSMQQQAVLSPAGTTQAVPNMLKQTPAATCTAAGSTEKRAEMPAAPAPPRAFIPSDSRPIESPDAPENRAVGSELPNSSSGSGRGASGGGRDRRRVGAALAVSALAAPCVPSFPSPSRVIFSESASMATAAVATVAVAAHACGQPPRPYHHRADTSPTAWRGAAWSPANPARSRTDEAALPPPAAALACRDGSAASPPPSSVGCGGPGVHPALAGPGRPRPGGTGGYQVIRLDRRNAGEPPGDCDRAKRSPNASSTSPCGLTMTSACSSRCSVLDEARDHHAHSIRGFSSSSLASGPVDAVHGDTHPAGDAKPGSSRAVHWSSDVAGTRRARGEVRRAAARAVQSAWRRSSAAAELQRRVAGRAAARLVGEERQLHAHAALLLQAWARGWLARRRARAAAARYTDTQRTDAPSAQAAWAIEREARYMDTQRMHASSAQAVWILEQEARRNDTQRTHVSSAQAAWAVDRYNDTQRTHASSAQAAWPLEQEARRREYQRSYNDTQRTHASSGNNTQRTHVSSAQAAWALEQEARRLRAERRSLQETVLYLRMENQLESGRSDALHGDLVRAKTRLALIDREVSRTRPRSPYASYGSHDGLSSVADPHADPLDRATTAAVARSLDDRRAAAGNREGEHRYYNYPNDRVDSAEYLAVGSSVADPHADPYDRASTAAVARSLDRRAAAGNREGEHRYYYPNGRVDGAGFPPAEYLAAGSGARSGGRACRADPNLGFEEHPGAGVHPSQSERPEAPRALPMEQAASPPESCRRGPWRAGSAAASSGAAAQTDLDHALERAASATPYRMPPPVRDPSDPPSPGPARICSSDGPGCPTDDERAETTPSPSSDSLAVAPSVKPDEDRCASSTSVPSPDPSYRLAVAVRDNAPACDREVAPAASSGSHRQKRNLGFVCELVPQGVDDRFDVVHRRTVSERKRGSLEREEASWVQGGHRALRLERKRREISRDREALRREAEAVEGEMRGPERLYATGDWGNENTALLLRALVHDGDRRDHELRAALASIQQTHKHLASAFYSHHPQPVLVSTRRTAASSSLASTPPDRKPSRSCLHPYQTPVSTSARTSPAAAKPRAKSKLQLSARQAAEAILYPDDPRHRPRHAWS